jgi:acyl-CoA synthetase (AMP-forming)/AMP-acid ligase II
VTNGSGWNFADLWEQVAERFPDEMAAIHGGRQLAWSEFDRRASGVAHTLIDAGLSSQDKVAQYLRNCPEYMESMFGCFKAGLVPVNTNFRYTDDELVYLWEDADVAAVVFDAEFTGVCERVRRRLPAVRMWLHVDNAATAEECPDWAVPYEDAASTSESRVTAPWGRSGDDLYLLYTGGTTGRPKGVMWRQDDLFKMLERVQGRTPPDPASATEYVNRIGRRGPRVLPAAPLMHGTAAWFVMPALSQGGAVVTVGGASLDAERLLDAIVEWNVRGVCIVGDPMARPILNALDLQLQRWDLSGLRVIFSSGAIFRAENKQRLLAYASNAVVLDGLGSSESGSLAASVTEAGSRSGSGEATARFRLSPDARVIDEDGRDVVPGSGQEGRLAVGGHLPLGYYGDAEKTAATFIQLDSRRYVVAGDRAMVNADGTITLLGRGSGCINTGGEKVYPEEVEEVLKTAEGVLDAAVVGVPDERFGEAVAAVVRAEPGFPLDTNRLIAHVRQHLAGYKAPRRIVAVESDLRGANGKLDYPWLQKIIAKELAPGGRHE